MDSSEAAPPIEKALSRLKRKNYIQSQATEFLTDKVGYVKRKQDERKKEFKDVEGRLSKMREDLIKKGIDYKTIKMLMSDFVKNEEKVSKSMEKELYPIVITLKTKSIRLK